MNETNAWDMRAQFLMRVQDLLTLADTYRMQGDLRMWVETLRAVKGRISPLCAHDAAELTAGAEALCDLLYAPEEEEDDHFRRYNELWDMLDAYNSLIWRTLDRHGLSIPKKGDPHHAMAQIGES